MVGLAVALPGGAAPCTWFLEGDDLFGPVQEVVLTRTEGNETHTILLRYDREGFPVARLAKPPHWGPFGPEKFVFGFSSDLLPADFGILRVERSGASTWVLRGAEVPPEYQVPFSPPGGARRPPSGPHLGGFLPGEALPPGSKVVEPGEGPPIEERRVVLEWDAEARRLTMARYEFSLLHTYEFFFDADCRLSLIRHLDDHGDLKRVFWRFYEGGCLVREYVWDVRPDVRNEALQTWWGAWLTRSWVYLPGGFTTFEIDTDPQRTGVDRLVSIDELAFDHYGNWTHRRVRSREWAEFCLVGPPPCDREVVETRVITYYPEDARQ